MKGAYNNIVGLDKVAATLMGRKAMAMAEVKRSKLILSAAEATMVEVDEARKGGTQAAKDALASAKEDLVTKEAELQTIATELDAATVACEEAVSDRLLHYNQDIWDQFLLQVQQAAGAPTPQEPAAPDIVEEERVSLEGLGHLASLFPSAGQSPLYLQGREEEIVLPATYMESLMGVCADLSRVFLSDPDVSEWGLSPTAVMRMMEHLDNAVGTFSEEQRAGLNATVLADKSSNAQLSNMAPLLLQVRDMILETHCDDDGVVDENVAQNIDLMSAAMSVRPREVTQAVPTSDDIIRTERRRPEDDDSSVGDKALAAKLLKCTAQLPWTDIAPAIDGALSPEQVRCMFLSVMGSNMAKASDTCKSFKNLLGCLGSLPNLTPVAITINSDLDDITTFVSHSLSQVAAAYPSYCFIVPSTAQLAKTLFMAATVLAPGRVPAPGGDAIQALQCFSSVWLPKFPYLCYLAGKTPSRAGAVLRSVGKLLDMDILSFADIAGVERALTITYDQVQQLPADLPFEGKFSQLQNLHDSRSNAFSKSDAFATTGTGPMAFRTLASLSEDADVLKVIEAAQGLDSTSQARLIYQSAEQMPVSTGLAQLHRAMMDPSLAATRGNMSTNAAADFAISIAAFAREAARQEFMDITFDGIAPVPADSSQWAFFKVAQGTFDALRTCDFKKLRLMELAVAVLGPPRFMWSDPENRKAWLFDRRHLKVVPPLLSIIMRIIGVQQDGFGPAWLVEQLAPLYNSATQLVPFKEIVGLFEQYTAFMTTRVKSAARLSRKSMQPQASMRGVAGLITPMINALTKEKAEVDRALLTNARLQRAQPTASMFQHVEVYSQCDLDLGLGMRYGSPPAITPAAPPKAPTEGSKMKKQKLGTDVWLDPGSESPFTQSGLTVWLTAKPNEKFSKQVLFTERKTNSWTFAYLPIVRHLPNYRSFLYKPNVEQERLWESEEVATAAMKVRVAARMPLN